MKPNFLIIFLFLILFSGCNIFHRFDNVDNNKKNNKSALLTNLEIINAEFDKIFSGKTFSYKSTVESDIDHIFLTAYSENKSAEISVRVNTDSWRIINHGVRSERINLITGSNTIVVRVMLNELVNYYTLHIYRRIAGESLLSSIEFDSGTLTPVFSENIFEYYVEIDFDIKTIELNPVPKLASSLTSMTANNVAAESPIDLSSILTVVNIKVISGDGSFNTYKVSINRVLPLLKVEFNTNGGNDIQDKYIYKYDLIPPPPEPEKKGHTFAGWYSDELFENVWDFFNDLIISHMTIYSKWDINNYTVSFISNEGSEVDDMEVEFDTLIPSLPEPVREFYFFDGWFKEPELTEQWIISSDKIEDDTVLYAKWSPENLIEINIEWRTGDAITFSRTGNIIVPYGETLEVSVNQTFDSYQWYLNAEKLEGKTEKSIIINSIAVFAVNPQVGNNDLSVLVSKNGIQSLSTLKFKIIQY